jgi:hypothetical protein
MLCSRPVLSHRPHASPEAGSYSPEAGSFGPGVGSALPEIDSPSVPGSSGCESRYFQTSAETSKASELNQNGEVLLPSNLFRGGDKHYLNPGEPHISQLFTSQVQYVGTIKLILNLF